MRRPLGSQSLKEPVVTPKMLQFAHVVYLGVSHVSHNAKASVTGPYS
jgi:hypothetical protein